MNEKASAPRPGSPVGAWPEIPRAPWRPKATAARPRTPISLERIVDAAVRIIDSEGTGAVTMRRVAADLDTGAASLYAHVGSREDLLSHAHERVIADIAPPHFADLSWQDALREWAHRVYDVYRRHNDIARLSFADIPTGPAALTAMETMSSALLRAGVPAQVAMWALDRLALYVAADAYEGWLLGQRFGGGTPDEAETAGMEYFGQVASFFGSLPRERFPTILDNLDIMMSGDGRERFSMGLDLLIDGIASRIPSPPDGN